MTKSVIVTLSTFLFFISCNKETPNDNCKIYDDFFPCKNNDCTFIGKTEGKINDSLVANFIGNYFKSKYVNYWVVFSDSIHLGAKPTGNYLKGITTIIPSSKKSAPRIGITSSTNFLNECEMEMNTNIAINPTEIRTRDDKILIVRDSVFIKTKSLERWKRNFLDTTIIIDDEFLKTIERVLDNAPTHKEHKDPENL